VIYCPDCGGVDAHTPYCGQPPDLDDEEDDGDTVTRMPYRQASDWIETPPVEGGDG
jgi:hypothetical protein